MPCVYIETSRLKDILSALPELPPHNWLITALECYDYCGWDGCEKWTKRELFLTDEEFRRDVNLRNMQIIWGVFSAIPSEYAKEDVYQYPLPEAETQYYMSSRIVPGILWPFWNCMRMMAVSHSSVRMILFCWNHSASFLIRSVMKRLPIKS